MSAQNPYQAPATLSATAADTEGQPRLGVIRAVMIVLSLTGGGALCGLVIGLMLGIFAPDYYHAVFNNPGLNTVQVGAGLGFTQGLGVGLLVGCVSVLAVAIAHRRRRASSIES